MRECAFIAKFNIEIPTAQRFNCDYHIRRIIISSRLAILGDHALIFRSRLTVSP